MLDRLLESLTTRSVAVRAKVRSKCGPILAARSGMEDLRGKVVVITGASSGLGRATALRFAAAGALVIASARRQSALEETVRLCQEVGGKAHHYVADVTVEEDLVQLAAFAHAQRGSIDVWVNNAGTTLFGGLDDGPFEAHRRVIETNLIGPMLSARVVWPMFRRQRHGIMINVGSVLSKVAQPFVPSYVISKFGLVGLSEALRTTLVHERDIHVCTIYPYAMNTPHFQSGANYVGREARTMPPEQSPDEVAKAIVALARRPRRNRYVPRVALLGIALHALLPRTTERLLQDALTHWHFTPRKELQLPSEGNLFWPNDENASVLGVRPPRISTATFAAWIAWRLFTLPARELVAAVRRGLRSQSTST